MSVLQIENRDGALWVTFNRPELFNSLSPESMCGLMDMWKRAEEDDTVKLVVLTGAGDRAFCAGADLKLTIPLLSGAREPETEYDHRLLNTPDWLGQLMQRNRTFTKPVVAAINGTAMAGGCELALASDIRIASSNATFALSEARLGIINNWWAAYTHNLETARQLPDSSIDDAMQNIPGLLAESEGNLARISLAVGLVDKLVTNDESRAMLVELTGEDEESGDYRGIGFLDYLALARTPEEPKANKIAVITAVGTIVDGHAKAGTIGSLSLTELIRQAYDDEDVKAIVLRVDSGGGSKTASEIIRRELEYIQEDGIPVVASMGSVAASGGYWISATADEIWALPTTVTGSIGIFGVIPTFEKTLARYGINSDGVSTTPLAGGASLERGISPLAAEVIQSVIEAGYREFLAGVARGRDMTTEAVHEIAQGRVWSGEAALELGLVDQLGDLEQAIAAAATLADVDDYSVWYVEQEQSTQDMLLRELMARAPVLKSPLSIDPIARITRQLRQDLEFLSKLNDPQGAYVICGNCPMNP